MGRRERLFLHVHMVAMPLFTSQKLCEISSDASEQPETWQKCTCISQISVLVSFCCVSGWRASDIPRKSLPL